jgi:hypothetical protein
MKNRASAIGIASWVLAIILLIFAVGQMDVTRALIRSWWLVAHPPPHAFVVKHWFTHYTIASGVFAPAWCLIVLLLLWLSSRWRVLGTVALSLCFILLPMSCASAPNFDGGSGYFLGLEEIPFSAAERMQLDSHLTCVFEKLDRWGHDHGRFASSENDIRSVPLDDCNERSPYWQDGTPVQYSFRAVWNDGGPYRGVPDRPATVFYSVSSDGRQFAVTISGLNTPVANVPSMMKQTAFIGGKQPWWGLLAEQGHLSTY